MITFIVGTDTDAGKTFYGKTIAKKGHRLVIKPIETGKDYFVDINTSDSYGYANIQHLDINDINKYFFSVPVSPHFAAEIDNEKIDIEELKIFILEKKDVTVELAGGLMVPINNEITQLEFMKMFENIQVELVVGNKLGCVNHALMTLRILDNQNIKVSKIIINSFGKENSRMMKNNKETIEAFMKQKCEIIEI